ncbi:MAG: hypothetical protein IJ808_06735 [Muribaculaceae bacterium]|nr:hypothetical protein [Muribaculaceae bacterium]
MANKRQLKKAIQNSCGEMASECIMAQQLLATTDEARAQWDGIVIDIAILQATALKRVGNKFNKLQEQELTAFFRAESEKIASKMNALLPKKQA